MEEKKIPICVDLDGTLIKTDSLIESILLFLGKNPFNVFSIIGWALKGKAFLKSKIANAVIPNPKLFPYNQELLDKLRFYKDNGQNIVLVTASNIKIAASVSKHLDIFTDVYASDEKINLKGAAKSKFLTEHYGVNGYDYIGDSRADISVWKNARRALTVNNSNSLKKLLNKNNLAPDFINVEKRKFDILVLARVLRLPQWLKNTLVFVPLATSFSLLKIDSFVVGVLAFITFSLTASAIYIINDLVDLESDRQHPKKVKRPFASGDAPIIFGLIASPFLMLISLIVAWFLLPITFLITLVLYIVITLFYSLYLKQKVLIDVISLAALYTLRIIAGGFAVNVELSFWLLSFSMFIFLSLALIKRYIELKETFALGNQESIGRGYLSSDTKLLMSLGTASGYIAILVLALYINSEEVTLIYSEPRVLWMLCPLLLYWISRMWMQAERNNIQEDPVIFAIKDKITLLIVFFSIIIMGLAATPIWRSI